MDDNDGDIIAYIYPAVGTIGKQLAQEAIELNKGHPGYTPPRRSHLHDRNALHSGNPKTRKEGNGKKTANEEAQHPFEYEACIKVTFSHIPKTRHGLRCGHGEDAELQLDPLQGVGLYHFALTFDDSYRLIVRDLWSTSGTTVIYGKAERGPWSNFNWIVGGSDFLDGVSSIIVKVHSLLQFQLFIPHHDIQSKLYRDKVDRYRAGCVDVQQILSLGHVGLSSQARTTLPSGMFTCAKRPTKAVTLQKKIGEGSFASVYRVWVVDTGLQYALKKPKASMLLDRDAWEREAFIMERSKHKHIVSFLGVCAPPNAWLRLEYMSEGTLSDHIKANNHFSRVECGQILTQALDALTYLHSSDPQIVHRDIKPNNILISYRRPNDIFIKLADFGIAHEGGTLMTMCGTYCYIAPEIYVGTAIQKSQREAYTALVDVWSLGVVLAELLCGLPKDGGIYSMGVDWCETIYERVEMKSRVGNDEILSFILESMLRLEPGDRMTAADCHKRAVDLCVRTRGRSCSVNDGGCSTGCEDVENTIIPRSRHRLDNQIGTTSSDLGMRDSSLSRYIISNPERYAGSAKAPPPQAKATMVHVGQFLPKFRNPDDSLFYESTIGKILDEGYDEESETASTIIPIHRAESQERVEQALITSVSPHTASVEDSLLSTMEWSNFDDDDDAEITIEQVETLMSNESHASASLKRPSTSMSPPSPNPMERIKKRPKTSEREDQ
ncbi:period-4 [Trichoderma gamsii]|uniref:non-specific serine/threonine protein kinase n=1 Tax=Trichoderma gamsii TaxID=398673 RepID=A0A2P4ZG61_9HYPO|nr:period-4 [Trichoderma gamsii]PON23257.1 period-4 [Trichoderma gamsii]